MGPSGEVVNSLALWMGTSELHPHFVVMNFNNLQSNKKFMIVWQMKANYLRFQNLKNLHSCPPLFCPKQPN
jgi:hypothetical protein